MAGQRIAPRHHRFHILLTDAERTELDRLATLAQVDRAAVIRAAVFGARPPAGHRDALKLLGTEK
jgi:hypothetical protein